MTIFWLYGVGDLGFPLSFPFGVFCCYCRCLVPGIERTIALARLVLLGCIPARYAWGFPMQLDLSKTDGFALASSLEHEEEGRSSGEPPSPAHQHRRDKPASPAPWGQSLHIGPTPWGAVVAGRVPCPAASCFWLRSVFGGAADSAPGGCSPGFPASHLSVALSL